MAIFARNGRPADGASEAAPSGWPAMFKALRDADVAKVDDCRDDIDTLLVFAGLYSAVLTAFVIESYTHLQQDSQDVIIGLLQQIAAQNFTSGPGFLNSTNPSPSSPFFEPPLWAIRVNVLWFTSLLLSLASASFGILVKQWLREYLALEYAAPRERLRARQYRNPAMSEWKVFEIAAFLPLLLQVSLGLFFIGLCFFTAAVHDSVGRTTAPLVCAWAFLFLMTTIAPLFSPRCPYKTAFLKRALRVGRRYVGPPYRHFVRSIRLLPFVIRARASRERAFLAPRVHPISRRADRPTDEFVHSDDTEILIPIFEIGSDPGSGSIRRTLWDSAFELIREQHRVEEVLIEKEQDAIQEEDQVVQLEAEDGEILLSVDSLISDDSLLPTMLATLQQRLGTSLEEIPRFTLQIIGRRINRDLAVPRLTFIPDLRPLSRVAWFAVTDAIADHLQRGHGPLQSSRPDWVFNSVIILLSTSRYELSDATLGAIRTFLPRTQRAPDHQCAAGITLRQHFTEGNAALVNNTNLAQRLLRLRKPDTVICLHCIMDTCSFLVCQDPAHTLRHPSLRHLLDSHAGIDVLAAFPRALILDLFNILDPFLLWTISSQKDPAEIPGSHEALHIILQYGEKFERRDDAVKLCRQMLLTESGTPMLLVQFAALHPQCRVSEDIQEILWDVRASTSIEEYARIGSHLTAACERFCNGGDDGDDDVPLDYVRLCAAFIPWSLGGYQIARAFAKAIEQYRRTRGWRKELQRRDCWYSDAPSPTSYELFKADQALACRVLRLETWGIRSTELINALWPFVPHERRVEVLSSIRSNRPDYTPPTLLGPPTGQEGSGNGQGGTSVAQGAQEVGDAGQEAPEGQDGGGADAMDAEASGGADVNAVGVRAGGERTESKDAPEREVVEEGAAGDGGDVAGGGWAQGMSEMAGHRDGDA